MVDLKREEDVIHSAWTELHSSLLSSDFGGEMEDADKKQVVESVGWPLGIWADETNDIGRRLAGVKTPATFSSVTRRNSL